MLGLFVRKAGRVGDEVTKCNDGFVWFIAFASQCRKPAILNEVGKFRDEAFDLSFLLW